MTSPTEKLSGKRPDAVQEVLDDGFRASFLSAGSTGSKAASLPWQTAEVLAAEQDKKHKKAPVFIRLSPVEKAKVDYLREHVGINMQQFGKRVLMAAVEAELERLLSRE